MKITPIIGLEVHVELKTKSKMFCGCDANHFHIDANTHTCPVCLGLPGALPVPNKTACEWCIKLGLALGCSINEETFFERKNYFYPDLAKGYQITQLQKPFAVNGKINIDDQQVRINRAHMEEDTGKSVHQNGSTLLDFNRSGVPLVEIVSEPDITSPALAKKYLLKIQQLVRYLEISDADIEKGSMRCEPTVNLCIDDKFYTPLVEIKNVASLTGVMTAIEYEIDRQAKQFESDHIEKNSTNKTTRGWDADKNQTFLQREKEGSADYRYFPEPDIPPIVFTQEQIQEIKKTLPELPDDKIARYQQNYGLSDYDSKLITKDRKNAEVFDYWVKVFGQDKQKIKFAANHFIDNYSLELKINKPDPKQVYKIITMQSENTISSSVAKTLFTKAFEGEDVESYANKNNLFQVSDSNVLEKLAQKVIADNPKAVADYQKNPASIGFLIGQLMKASKGSANPQLAKETLEKLLS